MTVPEQWTIDAEIVHNYHPRYEAQPWVATLPAAARAALRLACMRHQQVGSDAGDEALKLAARFPETFRVPQSA